MKINYQETIDDLATRISIHNKHGSRDIDQWMLEILQLSRGMKILDIGCGSGKQCFSFYKHLEGNCEIVGGDISKEMVTRAQEASRDSDMLIEFMDLNFNERLPFADNHFDLVSCCFAIYYAEDIPFTIREMHRVLKSNGKLFTTGPMPENKSLFYDIIHEATRKDIPPMPGSSRYGSEILSSIKNKFSYVDNRIFKNPLTFDTHEPFIDYVRASLSEDRKLWRSFFQSEKDFELIMKQITDVAKQRIVPNEKLVMTKVVGGIIATK